MIINLPRDVIQEVDALAAKDGVERADIIRQALVEYFRARKSRRLRDRMMAEAQAQGLYDDNDVFRALS